VDGIIVATKTLGFSIDVHDIRVVIHIGTVWRLKDYAQVVDEYGVIERTATQGQSHLWCPDHELHSADGLDLEDYNQSQLIVIPVGRDLC
jgi:hypothetical protein